MPGFELFGDAERKEVNDVLETGILMRYGFDGPRKGIWKSKELEQPMYHLGAPIAQLTIKWYFSVNNSFAALGWRRR